jgi:holo-[acyl-carrier protein] synthase
MCDKILGIGTDIVDIRRIERLIGDHEDRFIQRIFTPTEQARANQYPDHKQKMASYAKRFAAKEAIVKSLGTGFSSTILFQDIEIENDAKGKPMATLKGGALAHLNDLLPQGSQGRLEISLTDEYPLAQAFVVLISETKHP